MAKRAKKKKASAKKTPAKRKNPNGGQPTKYHSKYCRQIVTYFTIKPTKSVIVKTITTKSGLKTEETEERPERLRFFSNFAWEIGVCHDTLLEWVEKHPKFSVAYAYAKELQKQHLITCGLFKLFDGKFTKFTAINITDMKDKQEVAYSGGVSLGVAYHEAMTDGDK